MEIQRDTEKPSEMERFYRCPGCGQMVDNERRDEIQIHHRHVIEQSMPPLWFQQTAASERQR
jgi:uncharacterized C2H2 Zn-finger protein